MVVGSFTSPKLQERIWSGPARVILIPVGISCPIIALYHLLASQYGQPMPDYVSQTSVEKLRGLPEHPSVLAQSILWQSPQTTRPVFQAALLPFSRPWGVTEYGSFY